MRRVIWNGRWPTRSETVARTRLSSDKKGSPKPRLRAVALDKRLWASHSKFCWQFRILSLCASLLDGGYVLRGRVGLRITERDAVTSVSVCCLTWHRIRSRMKRIHYAGEGAAVLSGASGRGGLGGHFTPCHSMFVYRANSVTRSAVLGALWGEEGAVSSTLQKQPPGTLP